MSEDTPTASFDYPQYVRDTYRYVRHVYGQDPAAKPPKESFRGKPARYPSAARVAARRAANPKAAKLDAYHATVDATIVVAGASFKGYLDKAHVWVMPRATAAAMLGLTPAELRAEKKLFPRRFTSGIHIVQRTSHHGQRERLYWTRAGVIHLCRLSQRQGLKDRLPAILKQ